MRISGPPFSRPMSGPEMRAVRERLKMTQKEFGDHIGKRSISVSRYENGASGIQATTAAAVRLLDTVMTMQAERQEAQVDG